MVEAHFPIPIYNDIVVGTEFNQVQDEVSKIVNFYELSDSFQNNPLWNSHLLSDVNFSGNLLKDQNVPLLRTIIDKHLHIFLQNVGYSKSYNYDFEGSWMTKFKKGMYGHVHTHGASDISGVYYYQTSGQDGNLFFESPVKHMSTSYCFNHISNRLVVPAQAGKIVLFPSWVEHGIETNTTDSDRISISFNVVFEKHNMQFMRDS